MFSPLKWPHARIQHVLDAVSHWFGRVIERQAASNPQTEIWLSSSLKNNPSTIKKRSKQNYVHDFGFRTFSLVMIWIASPMSVVPFTLALGHSFGIH